MDFSRNVLLAPLEAGWLDAHVTIENLPLFCRSIDKVIESGESIGRIYCLWGEFEVRRQVTDDGLLFELPACPNDLSWTLRMIHDRGLDIHCQITTPSPDPDFVESIELFLDDWVLGLEQQFGRLTIQRVQHENLG